MSRLKTADRPYDIVLFGATGFVGELTAQYLAAHAPDGLRWAVAGRDGEKLRRLRDRLAAAADTAADVGVLLADVSDPDSLRELAGHARVVPRLSARTSVTATRWSPPAPTPVRTTSTSPGSPSSSTWRTSATTPARGRPAPAWCTPAVSTPSRTTSACTSPCGSCRRACR